MKKLSDFNLVFGVYRNGAVAHYQGPQRGFIHQGYRIAALSAAPTVNEIRQRVEVLFAIEGFDIDGYYVDEYELTTDKFGEPMVIIGLKHD